MTLREMNRWRIIMFALSAASAAGATALLFAPHGQYLGLRIVVLCANVGLGGFWSGALFNSKETKLRVAEVSIQIDEIRSQFEAYRATR